MLLTCHKNLVFIFFIIVKIFFSYLVWVFQFVVLTVITLIRSWLDGVFIFYFSVFDPIKLQIYRDGVWPGQSPRRCPHPCGGYFNFISHSIHSIYGAAQTGAMSHRCDGGASIWGRKKAPALHQTPTSEEQKDTFQQSTSEWSRWVSQVYFKALVSLHLSQNNI